MTQSKSVSHVMIFHLHARKNTLISSFHTFNQVCALFINSSDTFADVYSIILKQQVKHIYRHTDKHVMH